MASFPSRFLRTKSGDASQSFQSFVVETALSRSSRHASIYLSATIINLGIPFLMLPVLTRYLHPNAYAHVAIFQTLCALASAVSMFGLSGPLLRAFSVENRNTQNGYLAACLLVSCVVSLIMLAIVILFAHGLSAIADVPRSWLVTAVLAGIAATVFQFKLTALRAFGQPFAYGVVVNLQTVINVGLSVLGVVVLQADWKGRAGAIFAAGVVMAVWTAISFYRTGMIGRIRKQDVMELVPLGASASLYTIISVLMVNGDRIFLSAGYPPAVLGVYAVAAQLAAGYSVLGSALNLAWAPWAFRRLNAMHSEVQYRALFRIMIGVSGLIAVGAVVYGAVIFGVMEFLIGGRYAQAVVYLPLLLAGTVFMNVYFVFVFPIYYYRQPGILALSGFVVLAVAIASAVGLSHALGPIGVALTVFCMRFLMCIAIVASSWYLMRQGLKAASCAKANPAATETP